MQTIFLLGNLREQRSNLCEQ